MGKLKSLGVVGSVNSVRVILTNHDYRKVVLRQTKRPELFGLVGGKIPLGMLPTSQLLTEIGEETEIEATKISSLVFLAQFFMVNRTIWYPCAKYRALGFTLPMNCEDEDEVLIANPQASIFWARIEGDLPATHAEGRDVTLLDLSEPEKLSLIKPAHQQVLRQWLDVKGRVESFPREFHWES